MPKNGVFRHFPENALKFLSETSPVYIFSQLDWIERVAIHNSINFMERKAFQSDITAGRVNATSLKNMLPLLLETLGVSGS